MDDVVLIKKDDLKKMVGETVRQAIAEAMSVKKDQPTAFSIDEAVAYLNDNGLKITKSTIYKHTMEGTMPFRRFGQRKLIFDRQELEKWAEDRIK